MLGWVLLSLLVVRFYFWAIAPVPNPYLITRDASDYHSLLTRGFSKGQLSLDVEPDPVLAQLENPWDPKQREGRGLEDATYYNGRYYLYFGVTPVVVLMLPFHWLTGQYLSEPAACWVFALLGFAAALTLFLRAQRRYAPAASRLLVLGGGLALGFATMVPVLLRRASMWEVPITTGNAFFLLALWAVFEAWHSPRRNRWLALASVALGLAVGARHTYLLAFILPAYALWCWRPQGPVQVLAWLRDQAWRRSMLAIVVPAAFIGAGLAAYNYGRFSDPFEFGRTYQLSSENLSTGQSLGLANFWYGARIYLLEAPGWSPFFPFVTVISPPAPPPGYYGIENPYGVLPTLPFVLLGLGLLTLRRNTEAAPLRQFATGAILAVAALALILMSFFAATNRYMVYFVPGLIVLAALGWLLLNTQAWCRGLARFAVNLVATGLLLYSVAVNVLVSVQHNNLLRINHPQVYAPLARAGNELAARLDAYLGTEYGPIELDLSFPAEATGGAEALLATGTSFLSDYLYVMYTRNHVRFGFEHTSYGGFTSAPLRLPRGQRHLVRIAMGSLYPPRGHPYFDTLTDDDRERRQRLLQIVVNGQVVLERMTDFYDAT